MRSSKYVRQSGFRQSISRAVKVLTPLLYVIAVLVAPFHLLAHAAEASHWNDDCRLLLSSLEDSGHGETHEACALCEGLTRIAGIVPAISADALEPASSTGALGSPGTLHGVPAGHDFQRGPPREDFPVVRA